MTKKLQQLIIAMGLLMFCSTASADVFKSGDLYHLILSDEEKTVAVTNVQA